MEKIKLINSTFERTDLLRTKINLIFMDPPDNEGRRYNDYNDNIKDDDYVELLHKWIIKSTKITNGPIFISFAERWIPAIENIIYNYNILLIQRLYWTYTFGQSNKKRYTPSIRPIYWLNNDTIYPDAIKVPSARQIKYNDKRAASGGKMPDNIWTFNRVCGTFKERRKWHPTQHPEALLKRIILGHSKSGDTILDPFIGSGTTAYVCFENNRKIIGIDSSNYYINNIKSEFITRYNLTI